MASQPPANLPLFYQDLMPLSSSVHADFRVRNADTAPFLVNAHAIPITVDEFITAQRFYPIVFSVGEAPVPLALMGLNEGVNVFVDNDGRLLGETYIPAYVRRYPFMLAKLQPQAEELSLCFDPSSGLVAAGEEGNRMFDDQQPNDHLRSILKFCEDFEMAAQRTNAFVRELQEADLLIDGEVTIQPENAQQPFVYRGFQMVSDEKLRELHGDKLRKLNQNGALPLLMAHMFSLPMIRDIFGRQMQQGKVPQPELGFSAGTGTGTGNGAGNGAGGNA
ncbi:MAG TPA: SapC family protein [Allosphingosinicella sp.]